MVNGRTDLTSKDILSVSSFQYVATKHGERLSYKPL